MKGKSDKKKRMKKKAGSFMLHGFGEEIHQLGQNEQYTKSLLEHYTVQESCHNKKEQLIGCNIKIYLSIVDNNAITMHGLGMQITITYHSETNEQMINK